ncbi:hypothetical protein SJX93_09835 [Streptomyces cyaneofuscatus]|uniref:hypothetical protein n=1 Tax=Streptomyces cyaneofuscatus TaxID=66883 RepID=UPI002D7A18BB|nr:hypothetical protein [Streptomyces cyaneofuscatus]WRO09905.1 hypothetical protein SJX93_09835 [Streptomyces cyaneofuscatus]
MDLDALRFANFATLDEAVSDWGLLVRHLVDLKKQAQDGLRKAANTADWAGMNAQVTKEFVGKTAGEFADAHTQANTIHKILSDTRDELRQYKKDLEGAISRGQKKNLTVTATGNGGFTVTMNIHPDRAAKGTSVPEHSESDVTALRDEVQAILQKATESDSSASKVLTAIADQAKMGFSEASYKDRDSAAAAVEAAEDLAEIAAKKPKDLTPADIDKINEGLATHKDDPLFAERFATQLGPQKTLEFWQGINDPVVNPNVGRERLDKLDDLQRNLGLTLATATQSDSADMTSWKGNMIKLGDQPIGRDGGGPMGFQVMSNLMRTGDYDDQFLKSYGTKLMETERKLTGNGEHANMAWQHLGIDPWLNRIGDDSGDDPLTGYLKGLSNSPDAATDFFNEEYVSKDDSPFERDTDGNGKKGNVPLSNFQYLFEEREWPQESNLKGDDDNTGRNNLALALEAATTGHPAGELPTVDTPAHNEGQTKLFESIVASVAEDNERLTKHNYMSDSIGQITSEYLPDINRAMTNDSDGETDKLFPVAGSSATLNHRDVNALLLTVGQNPEGYAAVEVANKVYMANLMDYHLNPDLPADKVYSKDPEFAVHEIAHGSGEVSGTLAMGRQEAVAGEAEEADKKYEQSVAQWKNAISGGIGTGIGVGTSFVASPVGGAVAGGVADTASSMILDSLFKDAEGKAKDDAGPVMGELWESGVEKNSEYTEQAVEAAAKAHGRDDLMDNSIDEKARRAAQDGFMAAGTNTEQMNPHLKTDI